MMNMTQYPVLKWFFRVERVEDEAQAVAGWIALVRAQGWSPIGEPQIVHDGDFAIVGRLIKVAGLDVSPDFDGFAISVPNS